MKVLTVDYRSPDAPALFCQSLKETGFGVLSDHPVPVDLINDTYKQWQQFFASDEKNKYSHRDRSQDGYFAFRTENAKDTPVKDLKEFFHFYPDGCKPKELETSTMALYTAMQKLASELLVWIEAHLPEVVSSKLSMPLKDMIVNSPNTLLRILHYPPLPSEIEQGAIRAAAHEDINLITLLPAATAPGLEVKDAGGNWHQVPCEMGNIVVNVGDMLQMATDYYFKSTTHRVVNPESEMQRTSRYSMPLFLHAREEVRLSDQYTVGAYLHERLREIGIY